MLFASRGPGRLDMPFHLGQTGLSRERKPGVDPGKQGNHRNREHKGLS